MGDFVRVDFDRGDFDMGDFGLDPVNLLPVNAHFLAFPGIFDISGNFW